MIRAVLFDFDGVVVDSEPLHYKSFMEVLSPFGVSVGMARWYVEFAGTGSRRIFEVFVNENKIKEDIDTLVKKRKILYEGLIRNGQLKETDGIRDFLELLGKKGIKRAIVSGSHRTNVGVALEVLDLGHYFDQIVTGEDTEKRKPDPDPFLLAARKLNTPPSDCLVFEDSVAGSIAAKKAGMKLVVIESPALSSIKEFDLIIRDFKQDLEKITPLLI